MNLIKFSSKKYQLDCKTQEGMASVLCVTLYVHSRSQSDVCVVTGKRWRKYEKIRVGVARYRSILGCIQLEFLPKWLALL